MKILMRLGALIRFVLEMLYWIEQIESHSYCTERNHGKSQGKRLVSARTFFYYYFYVECQ
jgi:hypothetical protein